MADIVVIAPQAAIAELVPRLGLDLEGVAVVEARLEKGVAAARTAVDAGTRVLVSRGLTGRMIADALPHIPIVEIRFSGFDILRAFKEARAAGGLTALVGGSDMIEGFCSLEDILGRGGETVKIEVQDDRLYRAGVGQAILRGAVCIVGNQAVVQEAEARGVRGVVIRSGSEAVKLALQSARAELDRLRMREANAHQIDTIINAVDYGIMAIDGKGDITAINTEARRLLQQSGSGQARDEIIAEMLRLAAADGKRIGAIERLGPNMEVVANYLPIAIEGQVAGMVATFQELKQFQDIEQKTRRELARRGWVAKYRFADIHSVVPAMQRVIADAARLADYEANLLILGETGVGKEYFAHAIHQASGRRKGPFVAVNCASIPENILESELFGYAEGAFTGAKRGGKVGLFEQAHRGTIFLDEIGEMPEPCQARLLRVLQEHEVYRLGDDRTIPVDIRVVAATNRDLWAMVRNKRFREDLYYRLEVLTLEVPPLRDRKADIEMFVRDFISLFNRQYRASVAGVADEALTLLNAYSWPGNIRELKNLVGRLVALAGTAEISAGDVRRAMKNRLDSPRPVRGTFREAEMAVIRETLAKAGGNKQLAAEMLGVCRATLWRKLRQAEDAAQDE